MNIFFKYCSTLLIVVFITHSLVLLFADVGARQNGDFPYGNDSFVTEDSSDIILQFRSEEDVYDVWGDIRFNAPPRHPLGIEETDPPFKRDHGIGSVSNAEFTTPVFTVPDKPLRLNVNTLHGTTALSEAPYVMVEVLTPDGEVIPGFERRRCIIGDINALDYQLSWDNFLSPKNLDLELSRLTGREVALRFYIRDARVYALHTKSYEEKELDQLILSVEDTKLKPWETTKLTVRGEAEDGSFVNLDDEELNFFISDPNLVTAKSDKTNNHEGYVTITDEIEDSQTVELKAEIYSGNSASRRVIVASNSIDLKVSPLTESFKSSDFKMLFMQESDVVNPTGPITMDANSLEYYADTEGLPTTPKAMTVYNRKIGETYHFWGSSRGMYDIGSDGVEDDGFIYRATTKDGINFDMKKVTTSMHPSHFLSMVYSPEREEYIAFQRDYPKWHLHTSKDGWTFKYQGVPYWDHDGTNLVWDPMNKQYLSYNLTGQMLPRLRKYPDNMSSFNYLGARRVFSRRTSPDGMHWTPDNLWKGNKPETWLDEKDLMLVPDENDPVDMEFYWMNTFYYGDRYVALVMPYAPSPPEVLEKFPYDLYPSKHGPHLPVQWAFSKDLKNWERPYRDVRATTDWRIYFANAPMLLHDRMMFVAANQLYSYDQFGGGAIPGQNMEIYSLPIDRIASAGSTSEAAFSSKIFTMPADPLHLNVNGSVEVEVFDTQGNIISGYERNKNSISNIDALHHKLEWEGKDTVPLAGRNVQLRFYLDGARVYGIHTYK